MRPLTLRLLLLIMELLLHVLSLLTQCLVSAGVRLQLPVLCLQQPVAYLELLLEVLLR
jgi:hypothetical protein